MLTMNKKHKALLLSLTLLFLVGVGATIALLIDVPDEVKNAFNPSTVSCAVDEAFANNKVKSNVSVKNTGDIDAFIRAEIIVSWKNKAGDTYGVTPIEGEGKDYKITIPTDTGWIEKGGFYYYTSAVKPNAFTGTLISKCEQLKDAPAEGYYLSVEILASAIQAEGISDGIGNPGPVVDEPAIENAWKVTLPAAGSN